ncbi:PCMD domain-containing protein [Echinicola shivajiensis]|uniref:PCMD domain-containing protein n=1 Tax=Echinicola shivajiensis TaxID=1035916 RepID=UPI001BFCA144|nr:PCMD domain-containing protein [Echinicola shivajiensis]
MKTAGLLCIVLILYSCVNEDFFGLSSYGNIKALELSNQASNSLIDLEQKTVTVEFPAGIDLSSIRIQKMTISTFAIADRNIGDIINLEDEKEISITAEDGTVTIWTLIPLVASATPQLVNGDFELWYKTNSGYYEPGESKENTIWGTGNQGTYILNKLATVPYEIEDGNLAAKLITLDNGVLGGTFGAPIAAGSIFTGVFNTDNLDPRNPEAAIDFGMPFSGRPTKLRFKYSYRPGEKNEDRNGNALPYSDMADIYAFLEVRSNGKIERLATAWFRSGEEVSDLTTMEVDFYYGQLDPGFPEYLFPVDQEFVSEDSAQYILPTYITFVASSSFDGVNFAGAVDSELILDDVEMVYE